MKRILFVLIATCAVLPVRADFTSYVSRVTFTNTALGTTNGDTITVNADVRLYTNDVSSSLATMIASTNSTGWSATNTLLHLATYAVPGLDSIAAYSSNAIEITSALGSNLVVTLSSGVGVVTNWTVIYGDQSPLNLPLAIEPSPEERTNMANLLIAEVGGNYPTARIPAAAPALTNFVTLYTVQVVSNKYLHSSTGEAFVILSAVAISGNIQSLTNGSWLNGFLNGPTITNAAMIDGLVRRLVDGYWTNAHVDGAFLTNVWIQGILAGLTNGVLTNTTIQAPTITGGSATGMTLTNAILAGTYAEIQGLIPFLYLSAEISTDSVGPTILMHKWDGSKSSPSAVEVGDVLGHIAFGGYGDTAIQTSGRLYYKADEVFTDSEASGRFEFWLAPTNSTTLANRLQIYHDRTVIANELRPAGTVTNATMTGTNKLGVVGGPYVALAIPPLPVTSLANGNNAGVDPGGAIEIDVSGPTAAFSLNGLAGGFAGRVVEIRNGTGHPMTIENESGVDPTAANRFVTGTGGPLVSTNNPGHVRLKWHAGTARWDVKYITD